MINHNQFLTALEIKKAKGYTIVNTVKAATRLYGLDEESANHLERCLVEEELGVGSGEMSGDRICACLRECYESKDTVTLGKEGECADRNNALQAIEDAIKLAIVAKNREDL